MICSCGLALALVVAGASGAEEVPRSRAEIALSFAPVVRATAPAVVNIYARKQRHRSAVNPFSSDPFFRFSSLNSAAARCRMTRRRIRSAPE